MQAVSRLVCLALKRDRFTEVLGKHHLEEIMAREKSAAVVTTRLMRLQVAPSLSAQPAAHPFCHRALLAFVIEQSAISVKLVQLSKVLLPSLQFLIAPMQLLLPMRCSRTCARLLHASKPAVPRLSICSMSEAWKWGCCAGRPRACPPTCRRRCC